MADFDDMVAREIADWMRLDPWRRMSLTEICSHLRRSSAVVKRVLEQRDDLFNWRLSRCERYRLWRLSDFR